ncbi:hypothetical protein M422DRAFT_194887, partial [Sphaerobolus stellatus SS14]
FYASASEYVPLDKQRLVKKLDRCILPLMCLLYLFAYLDRTNLSLFAYYSPSCFTSNVCLQGLPQDILGGDHTGKLFNWVNSAFFFSYNLCQVPMTIIMKLFNPHIWMGCIAIGMNLPIRFSSKMIYLIRLVNLLHSYIN